MNILILICVTVPVFVAACIVFSITKNRLLKVVGQVFIVAVIASWVYYNFESVQKPLRFESEQKKRYDATVQRLKDIRTAQSAYRSEYKKYTNSFDTLIKFLKSDSISVVKIVGDEDDSATVAAIASDKIVKGKVLAVDKTNASITLELNKKRVTVKLSSRVDSLPVGSQAFCVSEGNSNLYRVTMYKKTEKVSVLDSLFKKNYKVDSLCFVPFTEGVKFDMDTAYIKAGNVTVNVFEAKVPFKVLLKGLDEQLLHNSIIKQQQRTGYDGLRVGSLTEPTNNVGNWE